MKRSIKLAPSILAADFMNLGTQIREVKENGAQYLHYDVMDGMFVPSMSFGLPVLASVRAGTDIFIDCHLMIVEPDRYIDEFAKAGADSITVHFEACNEVGLTDVIRHIRKTGKRCGISINPETPLVHILPYLGMADMILIMSVKPGFGGQQFIESTYSKLRELASLRDEGGFDFDIEVDGGITLDNAGQVIEAGANVIVSGSSVFHGDIERNVKEFMKRFDAYMR
ncbi:MAG: ribulose-phosphate 3-epimerase [Lachnospiraceae bacterium]|nr:ribulose-phosphate 3-epimerase [Lachnospiraceae bacterium]